MSAPFSPIITVAVLVLPETTVGVMHRLEAPLVPGGPDR